MEINNITKGDYVVYNGKTEYSFDDFTTEMMNDNLITGKLYRIAEITYEYEIFLESRGRTGPLYRLRGSIWYYPHQSFDRLFK